MSSTKRCRRPSSPSPEPSESTPKRHCPNCTTPILRLSDELFLRICFHLPIRDLASFQLVSHRCSRIAVDGQIWKALYYQRFVLPRASRIRGLVRGQLGDYSPRRSRWLEEGGIAREAGTNWKALYKLRHNWGRGSCVTREIDVAGEDGKVDHGDEGELLVRLFDGIVFTASLKLGLRSWRLHNTDELIARISLYSNSAPFSRFGVPTALAVDEESIGKDGMVNVTVGFNNGGFTTYQLDMTEKHPIFRMRYVHTARERSRDSPTSTKITVMASLGPYLATMTGQTWDIYDFSCPPVPVSENEEGKNGVGGTAGVGISSDSVGTDSNSSSQSRTSPSSISCMTPTSHLLHAPKVLSSLRSSTAWPPLALSLRRSVNETLLASIVYSCPLLTGWSVGCQELKFKTVTGTPTSGETKRQAVVQESRIATAVPSGFTPLSNPSPTSPSGSSSQSAGGAGGGGGQGLTGVSCTFTGHGRSQSHDPPLARPTSTSYNHPYLITSHADNTLTLFLVRSAATLTIDPGQRLWGHTAGVSSVIVDGRGKAISINRNGSEIRVWELEGGVSERKRVNASVRVEPVVRGDDVDWMANDNYSSLGNTTINRLVSKGHLGGFDDNKVVVLRESSSPSSFTPADTPASCSVAAAAEPVTMQGKQVLVVYDFTR